MFRAMRWAPFLRRARARCCRFASPQTLQRDYFAKAFALPGRRARSLVIGLSYLLTGIAIRLTLI